MSTVLIVGGTRGLGASLVSRYAQSQDVKMYATARGTEAPKDTKVTAQWITEIDLMQPDCGDKLAAALKGVKLDVVYITAGFFATEQFKDGPAWDDQVRMYTTSSIAPTAIVYSLVSKSNFKKGAKLVLVSSESGSITLRHASEGGGNFGHHGSKAALNMVGKLLSFDLKEHDISVAVLHPSFMRTEMTKSIGFDKYWDDGGALTPEQAAEIMSSWVDKDLTPERSGEYWAPRGTRDIGTWKATMGTGTEREGPVQLPW